MNPFKNIRMIGDGKIVIAGNTQRHPKEGGGKHTKRAPIARKADRRVANKRARKARRRNSR